MDRCTGRHCRPVLQLPTGQSCSWQTAGPNKLLALTQRSWRTWNETGQSTMKQNGRGQANLMGARTGEGQWAWQAKNGRQATKTARRTSHCRRTQPADSPPGSGLEQTNGPQLAGLAANTTAAADDVGFSLAVQVRGGSTVVLAAMKAGADLPILSLPPTNSFACHFPYPLT